MKVGYFINGQYPANESMPQKIQDSVELVRAVRDAGFDLICAGQHYLSDPFQMSATIPLLARMAAEAGDMQVAATVVLLPPHNPVDLAESVATMDAICGGRFVFGIGLGYRDEEYTAFGIDRSERVERMNESLEVMKLLWSEEEVEFHGKYYSIDGIQFEPKPVQQPGIPVWVGGHTKAALRRTARYGSCWHTTRQTPEFVAENLPYLRERVEKEGRAQSEVTVSLKRSLHFTDKGLVEGGYVRSGGSLVATTQEVIDDLGACQEIGIDQLTYDFRVESLSDCIKVMEHVADKVLPVARRLG